MAGDGTDGDPSNGGLGEDPSTDLYLKAGIYDPLSDEAPGPSFLLGGSTHPYYLVQFDGPIKGEWTKEVGDLGVSLLQYLPDFGFFTRMPRDAVDDVRNLEHVRHVGPIHPAFRIHPSLWQDLRSDGAAQVQLLTWDQSTVERIAGLVLGDGGTVSLIDLDSLVVTVSLRTATALVRDPSLAVRWMEPFAPPELINDNDARTAKARQASDGTYISDGNALWSYNPTTDTFEGFTGKNVTVAVADTGLDTTHPTFAGRIVEYFDYGNDGEHDANGHGTHVAGTALGDGGWRIGDVGTDGKYAGLAPDAGLVVQEVFVAGNPGANGMGRDAEGQGVSISSNSWISGAFGDYNGQCEAYDRLTHDANNVKPGEQPILYVFGAGNDGRQGLGSIRPPSLAKNVISVGSTGNDKWGASSNFVSDFSARGPVEDGRIKPDVLLPGYIVASSKSSYPGANGGYPRPPDGQSSYVYGTGTSMATPGVSGAAAVVTQYVRDVDEHEPSPAFIKAILINGAQPLPGYEYPGMVQGWGRVDLDKSLLETANYKIFREDQEVDLDTDAGSNVSSYWFMVKEDQPFKVSLTWSDVPGLVNSNKHLINDLDLELVDPDGNLYSGNSFVEGQSEANTTFKPDRLNNVEGILIDEPMEGLWNLRIRAYNVPQNTQNYALVVSGNIERGHVDLVSEGLTASPKQAEEGSPVALSATVRNLGNRDSDEAFFRLERVDPSRRTEVLDVGTLGGLSAKDTRHLSWIVTGVRGTHVFRLIIDPAKDIIESDEDNNDVEIFYFFKGFDVTLSSDATRMMGDPGSLISFTLTLGNKGNVQDELTLDLSDPPPGWQAQLTSSSHTLNPDGATNTLLEVMVPSNATAGERADVYVTVRSAGNSSKRATVHLEVEVNQIFGLEVAALTGRQDMLPGEDRVLELMVRNTGNGPDVYTLTLPEQLPGGWWVRLPNVTVDVPLRSEVTTSIVLTSPDPSLAGTSMNFAISVESSNPGLTKQVPFSARVVQFFSTEITVVRGVPEGDAGETIVISLKISNQGNGPVSYSGDINFPDPTWTGGLDISNLSLEGYSEANANLTFVVPDDAVNRSYDFTMVIIPSGGDNFFHDFTFAVRQFHDLDLTITSGTPKVTQGEGATVSLTLVNNGNGMEPVMLTSEPPSTWTFNLSEQMPVLEPFSTRVVDLFLDTELTTPGGIYDVLVLAYYGLAKTELAEATAQVEVMTRPDLQVTTGSINLSEPNPSVDMMVWITVTVANVGETVARDVFVQLFVDNAMVDQPQYMSSIEPGEIEEFTMIWRTNRSGLRELRVVADYQNEILEPDEDNNAATLAVNVKPLDLRTTPGLGYVMALLAFLSATLVTWRGRRRRAFT
jgi:uncharacterized membrane protein